MIASKTSQPVLNKVHEARLIQTRRERRSEFVHLDGLKKTLEMKLETRKPQKGQISAA